MDRKKVYWVASLLGAIVLVIIISFTVTKNVNSKGGHDSSYTTADGQNPDATTDLQRYLLKQDEIMAEMMDEMDIEPSGHASVDFLESMEAHHEAAVEMTESYLQYGGDTPKLKDLAENIIKTQNQEIDTMDAMADSIEDTQKKDISTENAYLKEYKKLMDSHSYMDHKSYSVSDVDTAFAKGMIMHHEMAVKMSEQILSYTEDTDVRTLAEKIIDTQKKEIQEMKDFLN